MKTPTTATGASPKSPRIEALPPLEAVRHPRKLISEPTEKPFTFFETIRYYAGTDRYLIWGPFYKGMRSVRRHRVNWEDLTLDSFWKGIPAATQTRPGLIERAINWAAGVDPPPNLTPHMPKPRTKAGDESKKDDASTRRTPKTPMTPRTPRKKTGYESWNEAFPTAEDWSPSRIDFTEWYGRFKHPADYDDDFFRTNYAVLYERVCDFAEKWFGCAVWLEDWRDSLTPASVWEVPMTEQFAQYASNVAHEDRGYVNWSEMLNDPRHRKWLCVAILAQIIERRIFDQLLFGASSWFQDELDRHDSQWVLLEGFSRKEGRRQIARASLGEGLLPDGFWDAVDDLAGHTVLIFKPLFTLMCLSTGKIATRDGATFWQEIHTILAMAGYFQVCMAVSPSIFHILSATPGARFQWEEEEHADKEIYEASKTFHKSHEARWRTIADLSMANRMDEVQRLLAALNDFDEAALYMPFPPNEEEYRHMSHERQRGGKVMYAVFPKLTRYAAENVGEIIGDPRDMLSPDAHALGEGMHITVLSRCKVVYYQGLVHAPDGSDDGVPLEAHLNQIAWDRMPGGFLPYRSRYWAPDGSATSGIVWPLWPDTLDKFWIFWTLSLVSSYVVRGIFGEPTTVAERYLYGGLLIKPPEALLIDAFVYLALRASGMRIFQSPWLYVKMQVFNMLFLVLLNVLLYLRSSNIRVFTYMCAPFVWLDIIIIDTLPRFILAWALALRDETPIGIVQHAIGHVGSLFSFGSRAAAAAAATAAAAAAATP
ncbi:hypothetical protein F4861DRAFT_358761 [Xylaria intraflava]|nr:hypothetical protein F4861DRAFT_358761 [Xylaria intraflava]